MEAKLLQFFMERHLLCTVPRRLSFGGAPSRRSIVIRLRAFKVWQFSPRTRVWLSHGAGPVDEHARDIAHEIL